MLNDINAGLCKVLAVPRGCYCLG